MTRSPGSTGRQTCQPDKPFFMYWAAGAIHGPHHVTKEWADKYKGKFDDGWDAYRERVFKRAKEKGWIPAEAQLTARHPEMPSWDSIPENEKPFHPRLMEVPAGFGEHVDVQIGRIVDEIDTLLWRQHADLLHLGRRRYVGAGPERHDQRAGGAQRYPHHHRTADAALEEIGGLDALGGPKTDPIYSAGWAWAGARRIRAR